MSTHFLFKIRGTGKSFRDSLVNRCEMDWVPTWLKPAPDCHWKICFGRSQNCHGFWSTQLQSCLQQPLWTCQCQSPALALLLLKRPLSTARYGHLGNSFSLLIFLSSTVRRVFFQTSVKSILPKEGWLICPPGKSMTFYLSCPLNLIACDPRPRHKTIIINYNYHQSIISKLVYMLPRFVSLGDFKYERRFKRILWKWKKHIRKDI